MNLDAIHKTVEEALWAQSSLLSTVSYVRPPSLSEDSSIVEGTETSANCLAFRRQSRVAGIGRLAREVQVFLIRASELTAILALGQPRRGDYIVDSSQNTFAVFAALPILGERVWEISAQEVTDEDFGSVAQSHNALEDRGDLIGAISAEDYGPLYT